MFSKNLIKVAMTLAAFVAGSGLTTYSLWGQNCNTVGECAFTFTSCSKNTGSKFQSAGYRCTSYCGSEYTNCKCIVYNCGASGLPNCSPMGTDIYTDVCDGLVSLCPCDV